MSDTPHPPSLFIRPSHGWSALNLSELWRYRELIGFLTWRDLKVRYKQTLLGASWAILQPVLSMIVFTLIFGGVGRMAEDLDVPYPIFSYTALLPWGLFSKALTDAGRSLVMNRNMITKIYFPRLAIPLASVFSGLVDFAIQFVVLIFLMFYFQTTGTVTNAAWTLPLFLLLALVTALGIGLWLSALNVIYRDVGYTLPFLTQLWFFITPIVYPLSKAVERYPSWQWLFAINPMTGVVEGFRWALLGLEKPDFGLMAISSVIAILLLISGLFYFRRMERTFADTV
ncbi:MAG TPA: ABC transporter permease [Anaerolineales bacterium]|nr:ABC transporter permease [Anaerolineales bacterium]